MKKPAPTNYNVLITSGSRKVSLVQSFQQAFKTLGLPGKVYASDAKPLAPSLYLSDQGILSPHTATKEYKPWLLKTCLQYHIGLVIPTRDAELPLFATIQPQFEKHGIWINIPSLATVKICNDKERFVAFCLQHDFGIPKTFTDADTITFPCFIRTATGSGSDQAYKVATTRELKTYRLVIRNPIIQEFIDWPECTVDYCADFKAQPLSVVPRQRLLTVGGESYVGKIDMNFDIISQAQALAQALKLVGHNTIQLFYNPETKVVKFIEVNPRYGGGASLGIAAGADTPRFLLSLILGKPVRYHQSRVTEQLLMLRYTQDIFLTADKILANTEPI